MTRKLNLYKEKLSIAIKDTNNYIKKNKKTFIILTLILILINLIDTGITYLALPNTDISDLLTIIVGISDIIFLFIEMGILATIIERTVHGKDYIKINGKIKQILKEGSKEIILILGYNTITIILFFLLIVLHTIIFGENMTMFIILSQITIIIFAFLTENAILNRAIHSGSLKNAFNIKEIFANTKKIGFEKTIVSTGLILLIGEIIIPSLKINFTPKGFVISMILVIVILPYLTIFTARYLGLIGRNVTGHEITTLID